MTAIAAMAAIVWEGNGLNNRVIGFILILLLSVGRKWGGSEEEVGRK